MPAEKPEQPVPKKTSGEKKTQRTKQISINTEAAKIPDPSPLLKVTRQQSDESISPPKTTAPAFQLNVQIPHAADEVIKNSAKIPKYAQKRSNLQTSEKVGKTIENRSNSTQFAPVALTSLAGSAPNPAQPSALPTPTSRFSKSKIVEIKIWNTLEWIATSALIFMVLFFIINFNAYGTLFGDKLNQLRGNLQTNASVQNLLHPASENQQPLPIVATAAQDKAEIPYLDMEVAPPDDRIIIPRINRNVPIVKISDADLIKRVWGALESDIQNALRDGVVHYPGTAEPGESGNVVLTGHSSYFSWDPGRFKDVFALLHEVVLGDTVIVYHNQQKYFYQVYGIEVVTPDNISVLSQDGPNHLTLITCTPVGTNLKRLVVFARPIADPGNT